MGTEELEDALLYSNNVFKVHHTMCTTLKKLTDRIADKFPEIEAARPGYSSGIQSLCLLNNTIDKSKQLLEYCLESSKLYLAITGEATILRFQNIKNTLENSLGEIRSNVPVILSAEISSIIDDLRATTFSLNPFDEEAGKVLLGLLHKPSQSDARQFNEKEAIQFAASRLLITTEKAIIIERRAIKKLLCKVGEDDVRKIKILKFFLFLLKKYGSIITDAQKNENFRMDENDADEVIRNGNDLDTDRYDAVGNCLELKEKQISTHTDPETNSTSRLTCPISGKLMYDPVVISSGETFERMWIQKWFDEGNTICPKTGKNLTDFTLTPNKVVRNLISDWCLKHGVRVADPNKLPVYTLDVSTSSIVSLCSAMNDIQFPLDSSNVSFESSDYSSDSRTKIMEVHGLASVVETEDYEVPQPSVNEDVDTFSSLSDLSWEDKCKLVGDIKYHLQYNPRSKYFMQSDSLVGPIITFLRDARDNNESTALKTGLELLLMLVKKHRIEILASDDNALGLLSSFLSTEHNGESLAILEVLSAEYPSYRLKIATSGVLLPLVKLVESSNRRFQEMAIKNLINLSSEAQICSQIVTFGCIQKSLPLLNDAKLARFCISLMKNLCGIEQGRASVAETDGCIAAISEILEGGTHEEQEHAVELILFLCTVRVEYCHLVMNEMIIPSLVYITNNGSDRGKALALELLRQLRDINFEEKSEALKCDQETIKQADTVIIEERKPSSKKRGYLKKNFNFFNKFISKKERLFD